MGSSRVLAAAMRKGEPTKATWWVRERGGGEVCVWVRERGEGCVCVGERGMKEGCV